MEQAQISALRREIAAIEGRPAGFVEGGPEAFAVGVDRKKSREQFVGRERPKRIAFGVEPLDHQLSGGLPIGALHEIRCDETRDSGALTGFAAALLTRLARFQSKPILWIEEDMALTEAGLPFGSGFARFGLGPGQLILIRARRPEDALWTLEEGLRCPGLAAVLAVIRQSPRTLDLTASRRLALRAATHGVMGLLLRQAGEAEPGAMTTRWRIAPQPAAAMDGFVDGIGRPAWRAVLEKSRLGPTGRFDLEWDHARTCFVQSAATDPVARPAVSVDRPDRAALLGAELAFRKAS